MALSSEIILFFKKENNTRYVKKNDQSKYSKSSYNLIYSDLDLGQLVISSDYNLDNNYILNANISDIVFNDKGMIGRIEELGRTSAKVLTVFNQNSVIPVNRFVPQDSKFFQNF